MRWHDIMKAAALGMAAMTLAASAGAQQITGAGATFPYPIYAKWAEAYKQAGKAGLNYQSIGSGGGIKQIKARTVDFGASDMPLKAEELEAAGLMQFPTIMGGVVPIVNIEGVGPGRLRLSGEVLGGIYTGRITKWNAPEIVQLNPGLELPASPIHPVYRADASGTTFQFTDYLSKVSSEFKEKIGSGTAVKWVTGLGGKGNEGVAANVQRIRNAIGYVEYAYAKRNGIAHAQLRNRAGQFVQPGQASFQAAAAGADWAATPGFGVILTDAPGKDSWPITAASFILMHRNQADAARGAEVLKFFDWAFRHGAAMASELDYVPLPEAVVKRVRDAWMAQLKGPDGQPIWKPAP